MHLHLLFWTLPSASQHNCFQVFAHLGSLLARVLDLTSDMERERHICPSSWPSPLFHSHSLVNLMSTCYVPGPVLGADNSKEAHPPQELTEDVSMTTTWRSSAEMKDPVPQARGGGALRPWVTRGASQGCHSIWPRREAAPGLCRPLGRAIRADGTASATGRFLSA